MTPFMDFMKWLSSLDYLSVCQWISGPATPAHVGLLVVLVVGNYYAWRRYW